jgi:hypothetical protein
LYYFHKKLKIKNKPKKKHFYWVFLGGFFWVFWVVFWVGFFWQPSMDLKILRKSKA